MGADAAPPMFAALAMAAVCTSTRKILAAARLKGRGIALQDAQIAGVAKAHQGVIVTRNVKDFAELGMPVVNPFEFSP